MLRSVITRPRAITYVAGVVLVSVWTVIRHFTNGVNFDVVGQVGVADQWARGLHSGSQLGATNYLLKIPVYYVVNQLGFLGPHLKLLLLALLFNVATFVLLLFLFEKLLQLHNVKITPYFYLVMLWLASISGRVYWLDYANSRNLETVGGIWVLYLGCQLLRQLSWRRGIVFVAAGIVVFFADQLQIYAIGGGLVLYVLLRVLLVRSRQRVNQAAVVIGGTAGAVVIAKLLTIAATKLLPVSFLAAPRVAPGGTLGQTIWGTIHGTMISTGRIFDASFYASGSRPNMLRELLNMAVLVFVVAAVYYFGRRMRNRSLALLCACGIIAVYAAYAASYQALQPITERYIVMAPLLLVLLFGSVAPGIPAHLTKGVVLGWTAVLGVSAILALGALAVSVPDRYTKDARITDALNFMKQSSFTLAVSSRDGIPDTYFADGIATVLPTICQSDHTLVESNLFYDQAAFKKLTAESGVVPIIVPGGGIVSGDSVCSLQDIENQFGNPEKVTDVAGVGVAVIYQSAVLQPQLHQ